MLQEMVHPHDQQLTLEEFCESELLFSNTRQISEEETATASNYCSYEEDHHSQYDESTQILSIHRMNNTFNNSTTSSSMDNDIKAVTATTTTTVDAATCSNNLSVLFDDYHNDISISASIDYNNNQLSFEDMMNGSSLQQYGSDHDHLWSTTAPPPMVAPIIGSPLSTSYEEDCLPSSLQSALIRLRSSLPAAAACSSMTMAPYNLPPPFSSESFTGSGGLIMGSGYFSSQELEFQGDNGALFLPDTMPRVFNCTTELNQSSIKGLSSESQHLVQGGATTSTTTTTTTTTTTHSSLEDPTFKVGKLSVEERKRKIHRYLKKRNERNFSKKIKYVCRKTLADSRPRVRGRFAKNDELRELGRHIDSSHEDQETDEDVVVKEEDMESSDILAHISGVNSFKCNYPIQYWI